MKIRAVLLYWHTLKHLRFIQIAGRVWFRLYRPRPDLSPAPELCAGSALWIRPPARTPSMTAATEWVFLNVHGALEDIGWDGPAREKLWRYNQHYFDDLNAVDAGKRHVWHCALIERWIADNPAGSGSGWEPYPTSLRIVNWAKSQLAGNKLSATARQSLAVQTRWLCRRMEVHLLGNHLLANTKALIFAGLLFEGKEAAKWLRKGLAVLEPQLQEQILEDGGHFELSPMYHLIVLEDLLDIFNLLRAMGRATPASLGMAITRMLSWSAVMRHPDGQIPFFNDSAFGIAPPPGELDAYAAQLGFAVAAAPKKALVHLQASGYARLANDGAVAFVDMAAIGPDYLPGHAHADTLSLELSINSRRAIVNGGTSVYGTGPERQRQRSTPDHSTLSIDGENSSEVWGGFRTARRARVSGVRCDHTSDVSHVEASHDGYARLPGSPVHRREYTLRNGSLTIADHITGAGEHQAQAVFILGQEMQPCHSGPSRIVVRSTSTGAELFTVDVEEHAKADIERTTWHPEFGKDIEAWKICIGFAVHQKAGHTSVIRWSLA